MISPTSIAETVRAAREAEGLSANALAERSGVSRAMIAKVERAEAQPTAALLGRLSAALGLTLSELVARAEQSDRRLVRAAEQPTWTDPETGYRRRALSPVPGGLLELVEVELPDGAEIAYPADAYAFIHQQIWMLDGSLTILEERPASRAGARGLPRVRRPLRADVHRPHAPAVTWSRITRRA